MKDKQTAYFAVKALMLNGGDFLIMHKAEEDFPLPYQNQEDIIKSGGN